MRLTRSKATDDTDRTDQTDQTDETERPDEADEAEPADQGDGGLVEDSVYVPPAGGSHVAEDRYEEDVEPSTGSRRADADADQREAFGGLHLGASIFGWLAGVGLAVILLGIVGAVAAGVGDSINFTQDDFERRGSELSVAAAITVVALIVVAYFCAGYVAGRMARFNGFRQGFGVWVVGVVVIGIATAVGLIFGDQYDVLQRVDLPEIPVSDDDLATGALITGAAVLVGSLLAALLGGKAGTHYHRRIDRT